MLNFTFYNPTKIIFGAGTIKNIAAEIPRGAKVMVTYGGGSVKKNGVLDEVKNALAGYTLDEFSGIEPNPTFETLMQCVEAVRAKKSDFLLAVGGGSVIDGTKFIAAAVHHEGDPWNIVESRGRAVTSAVPFGTVLTLPATGSEMNNGAVITRLATKTKLPFVHRLVYPRFSVLDPVKTYTLPPRQIANGIIDTFVHIIEQYLTYPVAGKVQDRLAEGLLRTLIEEGPRALTDPLDYDVRANLMWCATLGLNGLISAGVPQDWATHMIGHEITALHGLDHAVTLAIVLPALLTARRAEKKDKLLQYAQRVWDIRDGSDDERIHRAIDQTRTFFESLGVKTRLCDYNLSSDTISAVIDQLKAHNMIKLGEKADITPDVVENILRLCL
jgi:NADP-dependent alcohol dehydrogenase